MKPIKLTMTAFGPFAKTEVIAFDKLGDKPLFLINGATGSGKTTILDGICFALYGRTTGDERQAAQMRCDYADVDSIAKVELLFELKGNVYRIEREPDQQRPKVRGDGFTKHSAKAALYQVLTDGDESLMVAAKVTEATKAIETMTGLNVEQFRQVMVLPQGEFRRLLMADSADREKVFSQLFQTQMYRRIESTLKDKSAALRQELEALRNQQKGILGSADLTDEDAMESELEIQQSSLSVALTAKTTAVNNLNRAKKETIAAQKLAADFDRLVIEEIRLADLLTKESVIRHSRIELSNAREAIKIKPEYDQFQRTKDQLAQCVVKLNNAQESAATSADRLVNSKIAADSAQGKEPEVEGYRSQKLILTAYLDRVVTLDDARRQVVTQTREVERVKSLHQQQSKALEMAEKTLGDTRSELASVADKLKCLGAEQTTLSRLQDRLTLRRDLHEKEQELGVCQKNLKQQKAALSKAVDKCCYHEKAEKQMDLNWHRGQAALLARDLEDGVPCSVCGNEQHPEPAAWTSNIPDENQRAAAKDAVVVARQTQLAIEKTLAAFSATEQHLLADVSDRKVTLGEAALQSLEELGAMLSSQQKTVAGLEALSAHEQTLQQSFGELTVSTEALSAAVKTVESATTNAVTALAIANQAFVTAEAEIPVAYRTEGVLSNAISNLDRDLGLLQNSIKETLKKHEEAKLQNEEVKANLRNAAQATTDAEQHSLAAEMAWQLVMTSSVFTEQQAYLLAIRADDQITALQETIRGFETAVAEAQGSVNHLKVMLAECVNPELTAFIEREQKSAEAFSLAETNHADLDKRVSKLVDVKTKLNEAKQSAKIMEDQYAIIGTLSDVANGKTGDRVSLQRFVLSVLLDDVLVQASQRLKMMSKGRYELYRQREKGKGAGASGLELMVEDAYNGKQRPVATLSGGESFMAALSLALGLSDVVQAYAGGIKLDTLFVDEGFGSLDPESLDLAVNTLIDLQSSGRMIGIISHVPELKERINVRLDVHSSRTGSTTSVVVA